MKATFLDLDTVGPDDLLLSSLKSLPLSWEFHHSTSPVELLDRISNAEIIVTNKCELDAETLSHAHKLKYIPTT